MLSPIFHWVYFLHSIIYMTLYDHYNTPTKYRIGYNFIIEWWKSHLRLLFSLTKLTTHDFPLLGTNRNRLAFAQISRHWISFKQPGIRYMAPLGSGRDAIISLEYDDTCVSLLFHILEFQTDCKHNATFVIGNCNITHYLITFTKSLADQSLSYRR